MRRALACLAFAGLAAALPLCSVAQGMPEALKGSSLAVRVHAVIPWSANSPGSSPSATAPGEQPKPNSGGNSSGGSDAPPNGSAPSEKGPDWQVETVKYTIPGTPVAFKFVAANVAIIVQITPYGREDNKGATLVAQGQVWLKPAMGGLVYHTSIDTLSVDYGETVVFYPLGLNQAGKAAMLIEITVFRAADLPSPGGESQNGAGDKAGK